MALVGEEQKVAVPQIYLRPEASHMVHGAGVLSAAGTHIIGA